VDEVDEVDEDDENRLQTRLWKINHLLHARDNFHLPPMREYHMKTLRITRSVPDQDTPEKLLRQPVLDQKALVLYRSLSLNEVKTDEVSSRHLVD
jgi:hypothetical protein